MVTIKSGGENARRLDDLPKEMKEADVLDIILSGSRRGVAVTVTTIVPLTRYPRSSASTWDQPFSRNHSYPQLIHSFASAVRCAVFKKPYS